MFQRREETAILAWIHLSGEEIDIHMVGTGHWGTYSFIRSRWHLSSASSLPKWEEGFNPSAATYKAKRNQPLVVNVLSKDYRHLIATNVTLFTFTVIAMMPLLICKHKYENSTEWTYFSVLVETIIKETEISMVPFPLGAKSDPASINTPVRSGPASSKHSPPGASGNQMQLHLTTPHLWMEFAA